MLTLSDPKRASTKWRRGQSGNPAGRRVERLYDGPSIAELARLHTHDAIKTLVIALHHPRERVTAAIALLDRGWGKPDITVHTKNEHTVMHLIAAQATQILEAVTPETIEYQADDQPKE